MKVNGKHVRTVRFENGKCIMIEQNKLPFEFSWHVAETYKDSCHAIKSMIVRGAGAIGAVGAYAMAQSALEAPEENYLEFIDAAKQEINLTRPTAQNLFYATEAVYQKARLNRKDAVNEANRIADENAEEGRLIGEFGNQLIKQGMRIETHCNAGWLAFVDYGSALAPVYAAHDAGKNVFVYADETRPRAQGGRLTAWELYNHGVPHQIIPDNAGAYLMAQGKVDMMIVGADRIVANGDVANKIGTLEKAIAAQYYGVPFYVAAPISTFDINIATGKEIPIEQRGAEEVMMQTGLDVRGKMHSIFVNNPESDCVNPAFDVTPAKLIKGIITNKGIIEANEAAIKKLFDL
ncbi:MAG: S-methyl-5-thioribose-1-phosphate isomerase [Bacteroidota bacterium]|nr:S-methyl-5-thioribose-1-phosphate isomerase [Bacteroidota bacterium]